MNTSEVYSSANYRIITPVSICCALISILVSVGILSLIYFVKRLHTTTHLLICNTCFSSIFYSVVQSTNYIYLMFITWDTSDLSCRFRGYFGYMSIASVIYSYFIQALSRLFFSRLYTSHRWMISFQMQYLLIVSQWILVMLLPLPALITEDIYYRSMFLCWVPKEKSLHVVYTLFAYYLIPFVLIVVIYVHIYRGMKELEKNAMEAIRKIQQHRNLEILRNVLILIGIYTLGGLPTFIYIITRIEVFYSIGIILLPLFVAIEKMATIFLDREIRTSVKSHFCQPKTRVAPNNRNI